MGRSVTSGSGAISERVVVSRKGAILEVIVSSRLFVALGVIAFLKVPAFFELDVVLRDVVISARIAHFLLDVPWKMERNLKAIPK